MERDPSTESEDSPAIYEGAPIRGDDCGTHGVVEKPCVQSGVRVRQVGQAPTMGDSMISQEELVTMANTITEMSQRRVKGTWGQEDHEAVEHFANQVKSVLAQKSMGGA